MSVNPSLAWSPEHSSNSYLQLIRQILDERGKDLVPFEYALVREALNDVGVSHRSVEFLLDPNNWDVKTKARHARPQIWITAQHNQSGNLTVRWLPVENAEGDQSGFDREFLAWAKNMSEPIGASRPPFELMWFRGVGSLQADPGETLSLVQLTVLFAIRSRYEELLRYLQEHLTIAAHPRFAFETVGQRIAGWKLIDCDWRALIGPRD